ncbi:hypothetical protein T440DRAFT_469002, partial [Plenodomus tracheiphilus IPT5]
MHRVEFGESAALANDFARTCLICITPHLTYLFFRYDEGPSNTGSTMFGAGNHLFGGTRRITGSCDGKTTRWCGGEASRGTARF